MKRSNRMLLVIVTLMLAAMFLVTANVFVTVIGKVHLRSLTDLDKYVDSVSYIKENIIADRGMIFDANGLTVAQDEKTYNIICFMDPNRVGVGNKEAYVKDKEYTARVLSSILECDETAIYSILLNASNLYQTELGNYGRNIKEATKEKIEEYELQGVEFYESTHRAYPMGDYFAPYLVGFSQADENGKQVGKMGVEQYLNDELSGVDGYRLYQADKNGYILQGMKEETVESIDGYDIYLTLDSVIQNALATSLEETMISRNASRAWGGVMEIKTGKILAWGQTPTFDPNKMDITDYNNFGSQVLYEPGSVFKVFAYAAAIDSGVYDGNAYVDSGPFCYVSNGKDPVRTYNSSNYGCITNSEYKNYGYIEYDYGLILSSNTITSSIITDLITPDVYRSYLDSFGFFKRVNTDGIAELVGNINFNEPVEKLTVTYGHGLTVTMLELMQAYTAIFGNGEMIKPYFIDKIVDGYDSNKVIYEGSREVVSNPISESTAKTLQNILERVVSDEIGTARFYAVDGMKIMAKTGTAQLVSEDGEYDEGGTTITSVMIGFPYEDPQYMVYYAFQSDYDKNNHFFTDPVKSLVSKIALITNLTKTNVSDATIESTIEEYEMPSLINHTTVYAFEKLNGISDDVVIVGDGNILLNQYPEAGDRVYTGEKIFLLTSDDGSFEMMDLTSWSRKEVMQLWNISGVAFKLDGYGLVTEQSIIPGTYVSRNDIIEVKFDNLKDPNAGNVNIPEENNSDE